MNSERERFECGLSVRTRSLWSILEEAAEESEHAEQGKKIYSFFKLAAVCDCSRS